jgi:ATP-dependent DNA helicase RecG
VKLIGKKLNTPLAYLKGVGAQKADMMQKELGVSTFGHYLLHFPFRYEDRSTQQVIKEASTNNVTIRLKGVIISKEIVKGQRNRRMVCVMKDGSGFIELIWFKAIAIMDKIIHVNTEYYAYGKVNNFKGKKSIVHPELESVAEANAKLKSDFAPVYPSTEKLTSRGLDNRVRRNIASMILGALQPSDIPEILPSYLIKKYKLISRFQAIKLMHLPNNEKEMVAAQRRIKFEELFFFQLQAMINKVERQVKFKGFVFEKVGDNFNTFFKNYLPFELTGAQKRVIKEIRADLGNGKQMNRLLQGDVGSGKTIVSLLAALLAIDNGFQACIMAPTEILAQQHFASISESLAEMDICVNFLSGSVKGKKRALLLEDLAEGKIDILIGTHALIEDPVIFKNLGLAITDEQHRFGVKQRSKLWRKSKEHPPHILVMTATPIPRTLAMTVYGDLDVSVIDELPPGRKQIHTVHKTEAKRTEILRFMKAEIAKGRQIYVVYPLIEESETLDLQDLNNGYERILDYFPRPDYQISMVHGRMKPADKDWEMQRFVKGETNIMVATTVIEVGVNVPNASVMIIENAERFGLSQLHQLRGRVGRGGEQSYCILASGYKLSKEAKERIATMVRTTDGFEIAEADMRLRGPGNIDGTQQSGVLDLALVNLTKDQAILSVARLEAQNIIELDPLLSSEKNSVLKDYILRLGPRFKSWGKIS